MNFKSTIRFAAALCFAATSIVANAELQLVCPMEWNELSAIDGQDQDKIIYGVKARDWKKEYLDQMLAKEEECLKSNPLPDSVKRANFDDLRTRAYPNAISHIEARDQRQQQEIARIQKAAEENQRRIETQKQEQLQQQQEQQQAAERRAEQEKSDNLWKLFWIIAAVLGGWYWNKAVRNRCPNCKSASFDRTNETETDRWRGTKQVTEKHSRGTNTRHIQTTYVMKQFEYCCKNCQHEWMKEKREELGNSSPIRRFFVGY